MSAIDAEKPDQSDLIETLRGMADDYGEIAYTSNTGAILNEADEAGFVRAISGKFKCVEPGKLNSMYRLIGPAAIPATKP